MLFISQDNKQYIIVGDVYDNNLSEIILSENMNKFSVIIFILIIVIMIQMEGKCHFFLNYYCLSLKITVKPVLCGISREWGIMITRQVHLTSISTKYCPPSSSRRLYQRLFYFY